MKQFFNIFVLINGENLRTCASFSAELNRLWNLCPDNMAACRSKDRDFLPTLENYFEEAIEQLDPSVESQYKYKAFHFLFDERFSKNN